MISGFQMNEYHVEKIYLENPGMKISGDDLGLDYFADSRFSVQDNGWTGDVALGFRRGMTNGDNAKVVYEIIITGSFTAPKDDVIQNENDFEQRLRINGAASLVPIARAVLTATAAMTGRHEFYSLPNINVFQLKWRGDEQEGNDA